MNVYHLYVKLQGYWQWERQIEAKDHAEALRNVSQSLTARHKDLAIRIEQEDGYSVEPPAHK